MKRLWRTSCTTRGLSLTRQQAIPVIHENVRMDLGFRADLIVENKVVVEIKSVEAMRPFTKSNSLHIFASRTIDWDC